MPSPDPARVYKPSALSAWGIVAVFGLVYGGIGIGMVADYRQTGESGVVVGLLIIATFPFLVALQLTTSVTLHEQGIVVRQYVRREFIPWQAVAKIWPGSMHNCVVISVGTGVRYMDKMKDLYGTSGRKSRVRMIVAEMEEYRRRDRAARLAASAQDPPSGPSQARPVMPQSPADDDGGDRDFGPPLGKALW
jgi:hypothetical protein